MSPLSTQDPAAPAPGTVTDPHHLLPAQATEETVVRRRGPWRTLIILAVLLLIVGLIVWRIMAGRKADEAEAQRSAAAANRPVPVQTVSVQARTVPVFVSALGTVTAYNTVTLHSRVDGQLLQVNFTEGQHVHKGELLLQIDPRPYQATLDQALGTLAKDKATLDNTRAEAQRYTALYQAGVVSKEQQQTQVANAGQSEGAIKADQASIEAARVNLGYTRIYSPIDGVVGLRQVDPGNIVHASDSTGLVVITQVKPIAVVFTLPEDQLPLVQRAMQGGKKLTVEAYDRSDAHMIASGTLLTIDNQIDTTTGTAKLKAVFNNADNALFANQFVNVRLVLSERQNAIIIPTAAIQSGTQGDYVFVVNPGPTPADKRQNLPSQGIRGSKATGYKAKGTPNAAAGDAGAGAATQGGGHNGQSRPQFHADQVPVHVDFVIGTMSVLANGNLQPGQQVVVDGQEKLVDGGNVQPQQARNQPGAGANSNSGGVTGGTSSAVPENGQHANNASGPGMSAASNGSGTTAAGTGSGAAGTGGRSGSNGGGSR